MHFISVKKSKKTVWFAVSSYFKDSAFTAVWKVLKRATFSVNNRVLIKGEGVGPQCGASPYKTYIIKVLFSSCFNITGERTFVVIKES